MGLVERHGWDHDDGKNRKQEYESEHEVSIGDDTEAVKIEGISSFLYI
jgi:hypothetical protein